MENRYPAILFNLSSIEHNIKELNTKSIERNLEYVPVLKLVKSDYQVLKLVKKYNIKTVADSRIINLKKIQDVDIKKMLLRLPMLSELIDVVNYSDVCLISEIKTIRELNKKASSINKVYEIILMIETGDIREGLLDQNLIDNTIKEILTLSNIKLVGLGTNFACYGATVPEVSKLNKLAELKRFYENKYNIIIPTISCGNSSHITIWDDKNLDKDVNQFRSGAATLMGFGLNDDPIPFLKQDTFILETEIIELQTKPSASWGKRGLNAFAEEVQFEDIGNRLKAIVAIGRQDVDFNELIPIDSGIKILGSSSDHLILDITDSKNKYEVGSIISFNLTYSSVLSLITSEFVFKRYSK